jgi:hypothetical protein
LYLVIINNETYITRYVLYLVIINNETYITRYVLYLDGAVVVMII